MVASQICYTCGSTFTHSGLSVQLLTDPISAISLFPSLGASSDSQLCTQKKQRVSVKMKCFSSSQEESPGQSDARRYKSSGRNPFNVASLGLGSGAWRRRGRSGFLSSCWKKWWLETPPYGSGLGGLGSDGVCRVPGTMKGPHQQWHPRCKVPRTQGKVPPNKKQYRLNLMLFGGLHANLL